MNRKFILFPFALLPQLSLFAADGPAPNAGGNMLQTGLMLFVAILFFYFILWRPEQKRRKKMQQQRELLKKGDRVTAMGIIGTVTEIGETTVTLRMVKGAELEFLKSAITEVLSGDALDPKKTSETPSTK